MIPMFRPPAFDRTKALELISDALERGYIGEGPLCALLEKKLAATLNFERVLYLNSCTSALRLAFHLSGARPGVEVICTPMTCLATATAILETGASIVWADIDPATGNISPESVARMVTPKTVAIAAVDWGGSLCDFGRLREVTSGISIVEDAAHAFSEVGSTVPRGDFICFSGQAIKHWTTADGGALVCPGAALTERARLLRWFGLDRTRGASMRCLQNVAEAGFKMQGNDILAAVGLASLEGIADRLGTNRSNAAALRRRLADMRNVSVAPVDAMGAWWFFGIRVSNPGRFARFMTSRGVEVGQVHARLDTQACFDGARSDSLAGLNEFSSHQVNLPCGSHVTADDVETISRAVEAWNSSPDARW